MSDETGRCPDLKCARSRSGWSAANMVSNLLASKANQVTGALSSTLREFYPAALVAFDDLASGDALEVLRVAPTPELGQTLSLSKIAAALRRGGRQRRIEDRAAEIQSAL